MLDFRLLTNRDFLQFIGTSEFATFLVLLRHVWRGDVEHYMGLRQLYRDHRQLASSLTRKKIAEYTGIAEDNISRHLTALQKKGIIQIERTGRQNIFVLGEWIDVKGDGSHRGVEWFFIDGVFGVSKDDLTNSSDQSRRSASGQTRRKASDTNIEENREETVRGNGGLKTLPDLDQPEDKTEFVAEEILEELGDNHSANFYRLVAKKVPEPVIRRALAEIRADGADHPAKVFTHRMMRFARGENRESPKLEERNGWVAGPGKEGRTTKKQRSVYDRH